MSIRTPLCDLFGIEHPVLLAPMAGVSGSYGDDTERSSILDMARGLDWPTGWNLRAMRNAFTLRWSADMDGFMKNLSEEQARFEAASAAGDTDVAAVIVGETADLIRLREPAQVTLHGMISQAEDRLRCIGRLAEPIAGD